MVKFNESNIALDLLQGLKNNNVILYVGRGVKNAELSQAVCRLNWRCVITSQTKPDFGDIFGMDQRIPKRYTNIADLPSNIFDRINLPIIHIYGIEDNMDEGIDDIDDPIMAQLLRKKNAEKLMDRIMGRMDVRCKMVVIGYDPNNSNEFPMDAFMPLWYEMSGGSLLFFGMGEVSKETPELERCRNVADKRGFIWCNTSLHILLDNIEGTEENEDDEGQQVDGKSLFYKGKQPVTINTSVLLRCRNFAQLLTEENVYQRRPYGRAQQSIWFYNFLNDSAIMPQWYGYLPQSEFYLKRPFEDILVDLVDSMISGREMYTPGKVTPIILEGDPGSSKSITLAALAYRTFVKRSNPIVYIKNEDLLFNSGNSQELDQLDELLHQIELAGGKDVRTLILWDSASYRNVSELAKGLAHQLDNRGRRFVLVCTAYKGSGIVNREESKEKEEEEERKNLSCWYIHNSDGTFKRAKRRSTRKDVFFDGRNYFIQSTREITNKEKYQLQQKVKLYLNMEPNILKNNWKKLEEEGSNDIFIYFYRLVNMIRPNLEEQLNNEQRIVSAYVGKQLEILGARDQEENDSANVMLHALQKVGIMLSEEDKAVIGEEEEEQSYYDLDKFNRCIAMFSRFKLDTPYLLGIEMLYKKDSGQKQEFYNNIDLFNLVTNDIPWIYYGEDMYGNFVFRFRNSLEAEIFLEKNNVTPEEQIGIICDMIGYYAKTYKDQRYEDEILMHAIQKMLRMIGPNTDYLPFWQNGRNYNEHKMLLKQLDVVIDELSELREKYNIPDVDASFANIEITFLREYYGKLWDKLKDDSKGGENSEKLWEKKSEPYTVEDYAQRLTMLKKASDLALSNIDKLEKLKETVKHNTKRHLVDQINSLAVEISYCNTSLDELWGDYEQACKFNEKEGEIKREDICPLLYLHQYQMLVRAINTAPTNGYAYNALFNLFEKEYERSDEEQKLQLLSEVCMIADDAATLDITNRGMNGYDTLSNHIQKIKQYSSGVRVTIESILDESCPSSFKNLFNSMLMKNNASGITFVCQQELDNAKLGGKDLAFQQEDANKEYVLSEEQLAVCRKILDFMKREEYMLCVDKNSYALYLKLRVAWMYYNKRPMSDGREAKLTYIEPSHWDDIRQICEKYQACSGINKRPIVTLLHALSLVQLNEDYIQANHMMETLNEDVFASTARLRVPYIICCEPGVPKTYSGTVLSTKNFGGFIHVSGIPRQLGTKKGVRFVKKNLGMQFMPEERQMLNSLEVGLGYTGFSVYTEEGRKLKEENNE